MASLIKPVLVGVIFKLNILRYALVAAQCLQLLHGHPEVDRVSRVYIMNDSPNNVLQCAQKSQTGEDPISETG